MSDPIKKTGRTIVLVGGCFDLVHFGHVSFLKQAKALGNYLVVALESDENVHKLKGENRPIHSQAQRKQMLEALTAVDEIIMLPPTNGDKDYERLVAVIKPDVIAATEGDAVLEKKKQYADSVGAKFVVIPKVHTPSTSQLAKLLGLE